MKTFKVGDRVRIVGAHFQENRLHIGKEATVVKPYDDYPMCLEAGYGICIDGAPTPFGFKFWVASPQHLEPIVNPDETAWTEFKRYLQPDPAVILAKEPA